MLGKLGRWAVVVGVLFAVSNLGYYGYTTVFVEGLRERPGRVQRRQYLRGSRVGQLPSVTDQPGGNLGPTIYGAASAASGRVDTVVPVGDLDVVIRVQVQYAIA